MFILAWNAEFLAEIAFSNPLVTVPFVGFGSKGATRQNGITKVGEIKDGMSNTTLISEACGRSLQYFKGGISAPLPITATGMCWADSDNRITVTGTSYDGLTLSVYADGVLKNSETYPPFVKAVNTVLRSSDSSTNTLMRIARQCRGVQPTVVRLPHQWTTHSG